MLGGIKNFVSSFIKPKPEDFNQKGWLTPEQFVEAGNQLVMTGWQWKKTPSSNKPSDEPPDNQKHFLESYAVSYTRCLETMKHKFDGELDNNGFFLVESSLQNEDKSQNANDDQKVRSYTITISYDRKYHSPRMWLQGISQDNGEQLSQKEVFQDIMSEYQNETVTVEKHPFLGYPQVTIHPCNHSVTMKAFIDKANDNGVVLKPHQALFIFLKFMQSVMPTIIFDSTVDIALGED